MHAVLTIWVCRGWKSKPQPSACEVNVNENLKPLMGNGDAPYSEKFAVRVLYKKYSQIRVWKIRPSILAEQVDQGNFSRCGGYMYIIKSDIICNPKLNDKPI